MQTLVTAEVAPAETPENLPLRAILDGVADAVRILDPNALAILDANQADCELSGYDRAQLIGRDAREFWPDEPELRARIETHLVELRRHGSAQAFGLPYRTRDGRIILVDAKARVVEHASRYYHVVVARDATARLAVEAIRLEATERRLREGLASAAIHALRNPMAVVIGSLELLRTRIPDGTKEARWVDRAFTASRRILETVNQLDELDAVRFRGPAS